MKKFLEFLKQHGVFGLAIAVIIGGKVNEFVTTLVNDLFMPLIFRPALSLAHVDDIRELQFHGIFYGKVIGAGVDFLIVAFIVYLLAKFLLKSDKPVIKT